jgi:hypothetical protein
LHICILPIAQSLARMDHGTGSGSDRGGTGDD